MNALVERAEPVLWRTALGRMTGVVQRMEMIAELLGDGAVISTYNISTSSSLSRWEVEQRRQAQAGKAEWTFYLFY